MRRLTCQNCGHDVFFDSVSCVSCGQALAYAPQQAVMLSTAGERWQIGDVSYPACDNRADIGCNWLTTDDEALCEACRHNRLIPDLSVPGNAARWAKIEAAKRVLFYSLIAWDLPRAVKVAADDGGLAFDFLADQVLADGSEKNHLTGHANGLITINIAEGDDAERERRRTSMGEPYRTLVGHFRHEVGHYYWDRMVATDPARLESFRALFGDDREDYGEALKRHYDEGAPADWADNFISTYATAHAWEDFAETFAHYVHMVDGLETAAAFGAGVGNVAPIADPYQATDSAALVAAWVPTTVAINAINRSMGQPDLYPFVLSGPVSEKLAFIHDMVHRVPVAAG
ncbi:putative zinc-binding metallopeptidase [Acuticoccus sp. MNP-M23]|uniref:zinc-binding metallopeptidase family protein n=1 Tax=Acuticoccus sp. MNP-M23 TaxID=3072793 RepID=UPI002816510D|nr:putative zinc-binding metallopeptidase [Acuticoccus sp. MNP-M23]WMS44163.1 putative zinc-binding metallopeptidase [Acuticoccus sp. MNP-M23]